MTRPCPSPDELIQLLDGEVTENRAAQLREHFSGCSSCRSELLQQRQLLADIGAQRPGIPGSALASRIIEQATNAPLRATPRWVRRASFVAASCGALLLLLLIGPRALRRSDADFKARGGNHQGLSRYVAATLVRADRGMQPLQAGARVEPDATYGVTYRNLKGAPVYLLCFAVDANQQVHWLYPAYLDPKQDPAALELAATPAELALPESVMLDQPAAGRLRFISILATKPEQVSSIERLPPSELQTAALRARFPAAVVSELSVDVAGSP